jgi:hypothetical protein
VTENQRCFVEQTLEAEELVVGDILPDLKETIAFALSLSKRFSKIGNITEYN